MCGIVGYIGDRDIESVLMVGLERLSYRGYDSSGIATISDGELSCWKKSGKIHELEHTLENLLIKGELGIGHTRWATHGEANDMNAHPHLSQNEKFAIVHNGIIENFLALKKNLTKEGVIFRSNTDSEIIAHLIERYYNGDFFEAVRRTLDDLEGSYAIAAVSEHEPDRIIVAKLGSPLLLGIGKQENFVSSDINAIIAHTQSVIYLDDNELAVVEKEKLSIFNRSGVEIKKEVKTIRWDLEAAEKSGYEHFMLKEIFEQPVVVRTILSKYVKSKNKIEFNKLRFSAQEIAQISRFIIQACGTSWHAGLYGKYIIEGFAKVLTEVDISSEFRYRQMIGNSNDVVIALSQSGETADTLACIREAKSKFYKILSFVNVKESSMDRESDGVIYSHSGQEVGVASTKNFVSQLLSVYLFALYLSQIKWSVSDEEIQNRLEELQSLPEMIEKILNQADHIKAIAEKYHKSQEFIFIGRGINYPSALEGALKMKEISYIHATGYPAGELKHGPIALIDEKLPVVCLSPKSFTYDKMISNIQEVRARKGKTIIIATEGDEEIAKFADDIIYIPECKEEISPILVAIPLQLLAYYTAVLLECNVDQPRNLAKSVTVE